MVTFEESKMTFSFPEDDVYRIEKSPLLADVELKATECVVRKGDILLFVEAKSSTPRPQLEDKFDQFINEISTKFIHSLVFYNALMLRHDGKELPINVKNVNLSDVGYSFILVVHGHKLEWLPPLMDALKSSMRHTLKLWNISDVAVKVMNDQIALSNHIIVESK